MPTKFHRAIFKQGTPSADARDRVANGLFLYEFFDFMSLSLNYVFKPLAERDFNVYWCFVGRGGLTP